MAVLFLSNRFFFINHSLEGISMWCKKLSLAIGALLAMTAISFNASADYEIDDGYAVGCQATQTQYAVDTLPTLPADTAVTAAPTVASYHLVPSKGMQGVLLAVKDFRTIADSGGALIRRS